MVIGIDASRANKTQRTGTEWYAFYIIEYLKKIIPKDVRVVLYTQAPLGDDLKELPENWQQRILKWPINFLWTQLRLSWEMLLNRPDVLYIPAHTIPVIHPPVFTVIHDVGFLREKRLYATDYLGPRNLLLKRFLNFVVLMLSRGKYKATEYDYHRWSVKFAVKHASTIATVSNFSRQEILFFYPEVKNRLCLIPNGVEKFAMASSVKDGESLDKFGIKKNYLLYIGRLEEKKNVLSLIKIFFVLRNKFHYQGQLILVGNRGLNYNKIRGEILKNGLRDEVVETGWRLREELEVILASAQAFVFPSFYEGFGVPVLQAMASRVPVICNDIPPLREIAGEAAKFCDFTDINKTAAEISDFLTVSEGKKKSLLDMGQKQATKFKWENSAKLTWEQILCIGRKNKEN